MQNVQNLLKDVQIPAFYNVRCKICKDVLGDIQSTVRNSLKRQHTLDRIQPNYSVAVTAGSREISNIDIILKTICDELKSKGAKPFIIPSMGSHGGATADGQKEIIAGFGITEENIGVPIYSSMETVVIGKTRDNVEVHVDKYAFEADAVIPVARIKPHTDFRGEFESGLMKMMAIGLGKQQGASICHKLGMKNMSKNVLELGKKILKECTIPFGVGIIENAFHGTYKIEAIPSELIEAEEPILLRQAKDLLPVIPFEKVDVVIVREMGKDISGTGIDSNVVGRSASLGISKPFAERIGCFALTKKSHGNGNGMGLCDAVTEEFFKELDFDQTYPNAITSAETTAVKLPAVMPDEETCIKFCIKTCTGSGIDGVRMILIKNTLRLDNFLISEGLKKEAENIIDLEVLNGPHKLIFDKNGGLRKAEKGFEYEGTC